MPTTARRNSGVVQSDNVMVGAPIRRRSETTDTAAHRRRVSERSRAPKAEPGARVGRFTGVPKAEAVATERLLPDIESGGRRPKRQPRGRRQSDGNSPFQERSLIFSGGGAMSTIGGRSISDVKTADGEPDEQGSVEVDVPITYEIDSRFVVGRMVAAAPLAVEIETNDQAPQLEQQLIVNMPVEVENAWGTVYLVGKLLRVPEERGEEQVFVLHIERVLEGKHQGSYGRFLASSHGA